MSKGCGICGIYPRWLRDRATPKNFIAVYGLLGTVQAMAFIYIVVTLTTLEKRFKIPSRTTGKIYLPRLLASADRSPIICHSFSTKLSLTVTLVPTMNRSFKTLSAFEIVMLPHAWTRRCSKLSVYRLRYSISLMPISRMGDSMNYENSSFKGYCSQIILKIMIFECFSQKPFLSLCYKIIF